MRPHPHTVTVPPAIESDEHPIVVPEDARGPEAPRYETQRVIGEGGMGRVLLVRDRNVGPTVALKQLRDGSLADPQARSRFEREARVQGQLEHPAVVPVYDVGATDDGPFFTMKRVRGESLADILAKDAHAIGFTRRRLLTAFSQLCLAAHYAHERGVVHRDIKPSNIMLGPYGEVYLLDWGVAKLVNDDGLEARPGSDPDLPSPGGPHTAVGAVMGTVSTMAPEQALGGRVDERADVYALGAVLFEILTKKPFHPSGSFDDVLAAIGKGVEARASVRAPEADVPPELEALVVAATKLHPADRLPTALALHEGIERYLDGDRDLASRKAAAEKHAANARAVLERGADEEATRAGALREVGQALALDPTNKGALATFVGLLTTPPKTVPREVVLEQAADNRRRIRLGGIAATGIYGYISLNAVTTWKLGVHDMTVFLFAHVLWAGALLAGIMTIWRKTYTWLFVAFCFGVGAATYTTNVYSPYLLVSGLVIVQTTLYAFVRPPKMRIAIMMLAALAWTASVFGDQWGLFRRTIDFDGTSMRIHSDVIDFPEGFTRYYLFASMLAMIVLPALVVGALRRAWERQDQAMRLQAWQLKKLVSDEADKR